MSLRDFHRYKRVGFLWWKRYRCMVDGEEFKDREQAEFHCYKANQEARG